MWYCVLTKVHNLKPCGCCVFDLWLSDKATGVKINGFYHLKKLSNKVTGRICWHEEFRSELDVRFLRARETRQLREKLSHVLGRPPSVLFSTVCNAPGSSLVSAITCFLLAQNAVRRRMWSSWWTPRATTHVTPYAPSSGSPATSSSAWPSGEATSEWAWWLLAPTHRPCWLLLKETTSELSRLSLAASG